MHKLFLVVTCVLLYVCTMGVWRLLIERRLRRAHSALAKLPIDHEDIQRKIGSIPLYYVNCNVHTNRNAYMEGKMQELALEARRVEGVYGRDMAPDGTYTCTPPLRSWSPCYSRSN